MARLTDEERAAKLAEGLRQQQAKLDQLQARINNRQRKADTQRKIIIGGTVLAAMKDDKALAAQIEALVQKKVTRPQDKAAVAEFFAKVSAKSTKAEG